MTQAQLLQFEELFGVTFHNVNATIVDGWNHITIYNRGKYTSGQGFVVVPITFSLLEAIAKIIGTRDYHINPSSKDFDEPICEGAYTHEEWTENYLEIVYKGA